MTLVGQKFARIHNAVGVKRFLYGHHHRQFRRVFKRQEMLARNLTDTVFGRNGAVVAGNCPADNVSDFVIVLKGEVARNRADVKVQVAVAQMAENGRVDPIETAFEFIENREETRVIKTREARLTHERQPQI